MSFTERVTHIEFCLSSDGNTAISERGERRLITPEPHRHPVTGFFPEGYAFQAFKIEGDEKGDGAKIEIIGRTPLQLIESVDTADNDVHVCEIPASGKLTLLILNTRDPDVDVEEYSHPPTGEGVSIMYVLKPGELMCWMADPGQENRPAEVIEYTEPQFERLRFTNLEIELPEHYTKEDLKNAIRQAGRTFRDST